MSLDNDNLIARDIRNRNWRLVIISLIGIAIIVAVAALNRAYLVSFFRGPTDIDSETLANTTNLDELDLRWVTVHGSDAVNTGWVESSQSTMNGVPVGSESVSHTYFVVALPSDKLLLVEMGPQYQNSKTVPPDVTGGLTTYSSVVSKDIIPGLSKDITDINMELLPFMLSTDDYRTNGYIGFAVGGIIGLIALYVLIRAASRLADPTKDAAYKALERFGEPALVSHEIQQEMNALPKTNSKLLFTDHWTVLKQSGIKFTRHNDIMWVYPKVTTTRMYGVVPVSRRTDIVWLDRFGQQFSLPINKKQLESMMATFAAHSPGVILGYKPEIAALWAKNRADFIATVETRRTNAAKPQ